MASSKGLGSDKIDEQKKHDIQSEGGKASHSGGQQGQKGGTSSSLQDQGIVGSVTSIDDESMNDIDLSNDTSQHENPGNFANDTERASEAGKKGGSK